MSNTRKLKPSFADRIKALLKNSADPSKPHHYFTQFEGLGEIEAVFISGGVQYYRFTNEQKIPSLRAFAAKDVWAELNWRTTAEGLRGTLRAAIQLLNEGKAIQAGTLLEIQEQRLDWITHVDLLYKLASVLYFDSQENPLDWDPVYAHKKTTAWKNDTALDAFFLQTPIIELLPFGDLSKIDFQGFTSAQRKAELSQLTAISRVLSRGTGNEELNISLTSQMEILQSLTA